MTSDKGLKEIIKKFKKMTKEYEKLSGEKIPAAYYSSCILSLTLAHTRGRESVKSLDKK